MSHYQRYPAYRDSGVEWIGEIPGHWTVKRLKQTMRLITTKSGGETQNIALENIESWSGRYLPSDTEFEGDGVTFQVGDILFGKLRPYLAKAYLAEFQGAAVGDFHVMRPTRNSLFGRYALYLILNHGVISIVDGSTFGAKMPRVSWDFMGNIQLPVPPLEEQQAIASFLDRKTAEIDELITKKEELLKKLDEKRTALITRAVTKGLDPSAPMKESGLKWLGEIPTHWEVKKLKYVTDKVQTGTTPQSNDDEYFLDTTIIWYTPSDFSDQSLMLTDSKRKLNKIAIENGIVKIIPAGSVLVIGIGATLGKVGLSINQCCCNQQINGISPNSLIDAKFLLYSLLIKQEIMKLISNATTLGIMNQEKTKSIQLCIPPLEEQQAIAEHIEKKTAIIDRQKAQVTEAIERLNEYRSALITDAVTGKMDVHSHRTKESLSA